MKMKVETLHSQFPIDGIPCEMDVIGDTTAMSTPHEIDYTLTFSNFRETAGF